MIKFFIRLALVGGLLFVGAALVAGPHRVGAMIDQAQASITSIIDDNIEDPVVMRRQLRDLEQEYPERISQIRADLAELQHQIREIEREKAVANRVVELTEADLSDFQQVVNELESNVTAAANSASAVQVRGRRYNIDQAFARMQHIQQTQMAYAAQAQDAERDLGYLHQQSDRMKEVLAKLETERQQFQTQIWQLDRQVDAMARNERLISLMEKRQRTIDELGRYRVGSLDQLQGKLGEIRARQEATLQVLSNIESQSSYEDRAKLEVDYDTKSGQGWSAEVRFNVPSNELPTSF
jgi:chromosome segregation ATPase